MRMQCVLAVLLVSACAGGASNNSCHLDRDCLDGEICIGAKTCLAVAPTGSIQGTWVGQDAGYQTYTMTLNADGTLVQSSQGQTSTGAPSGPVMQDATGTYTFDGTSLSLTTDAATQKSTIHYPNIYLSDTKLVLAALIPATNGQGIVGTWTLTASGSITPKGGTSTEVKETDRYTFNADGTYTSQRTGTSGNEDDNGTYDLIASGTQVGHYALHSQVQVNHGRITYVLPVDGKVLAIGLPDIYLRLAR